MFDRMTRQFEEATKNMDTAGGMKAIEVDVADRGEEFVVTADVPGFDKEDLEVTLAGQQLQIKAHRSEASQSGGRPEMESGGQSDERSGGQGEQMNYIRKERIHETVSRTVKLPEEVAEENATADYKNGVLTVTLPKMHGDEKSRSIDIE